MKINNSVAEPTFVRFPKLVSRLSGERKKAAKNSLHVSVDGVSTLCGSAIPTDAEIQRFHQFGGDCGVCFGHPSSRGYILEVIDKSGLSGLSAVYVMASEKEQVVKVGWSDIPLRRLGELAKEKGVDDLALVYELRTPFVEEIEGVALWILAQKFDGKDGFYGEWFHRCTTQDAISAVLRSVAIVKERAALSVRAFSNFLLLKNWEEAAKSAEKLLTGLVLRQPASAVFPGKVFSLPPIKLKRPAC